MTKDAIKTHGEPDLWQLICKVSNDAEGWMKSTKAMPIPGLGSLVQVSTQQRNSDGSYALAEALAFVPVVTVRDGKIQVEPTKQQAMSRASKLRPSLLSTIQAFPLDGERIRVFDLRRKLVLSVGAVNTRLKHCRQVGLIERVGWGVYRLTDVGKTEIIIRTCKCQTAQPAQNDQDTPQDAPGDIEAPPDDPQTV